MLVETQEHPRQAFNLNNADVGRPATKVLNCVTERVPRFGAKPRAAVASEAELLRDRFYRRTLPRRATHNVQTRRNCSVRHKWFPLGVHILPLY